MNLKWTAHLAQKEEKENFKKYLSTSCKHSFERLSMILEEDLANTIKEMSADESYASPAWAEKQADRLGKIRTLRKVIDLLNIGA